MKTVNGQTVPAGSIVKSGAVVPAGEAWRWFAPGRYQVLGRPSADSPVIDMVLVVRATDSAAGAMPAALEAVTA